LCVPFCNLSAALCFLVSIMIGFIIYGKNTTFDETDDTMESAIWAKTWTADFFCTFAAMNWTIIIIETIVLTLAFTAMILIPLMKNPVWWIADYPEDIQEEYFKTHERIPSKFFTPTVLLKKGMALLIALALLLLVVKLAGAYDFWSALGVGYGIWLFIDWYDCFFLDWVLFANLKKVRLPGTEHMDEAYHQKKYHFIQSCWGMLIGLIPCLIGAGLFSWLLC